MIYFPYFRGRQFDLQALKAIAQQRILPPNLIPIIEPVRDIKALPQTVAAFVEHDQPLVIVTNPTVSDYALTQQKLHDWSPWRDNPNLILGHVLGPTTTPEALTPLKGHHTLLIARQYDELAAAQGAGWLDLPTYLLVPPEARIRQLLHRPTVSLFDHAWFPDREQTYADLTDGFFSDDWQRATWAHDQGFSDYTLTGGHYSEHGYPARAVTLHLTYFAGDQLRIRRFVSDDRSDSSIPRKSFSRPWPSWRPGFPTNPRRRKRQRPNSWRPTTTNTTFQASAWSSDSAWNTTSN